MSNGADNKPHAKQRTNTRDDRGSALAANLPKDAQIAALNPTHSLVYRLRIARLIAVTAVGLSLLFATVLALGFRNWPAAGFDAGFAGLHALAFCWLRRRQITAAAYWTTACTTVQILVGVILFVGAETGFQYYLLVMPVVCHLLFLSEPLRRQLGLMAVAVLVFIACESLEYPGWQTTISPVASKALYYANVFAVIATLFLAIRIFALEAIEAYRQQRRLASLDSLTGLFSRRFTLPYLRRCLQKAAYRDESVGVVLIDLDHFKDINDEYGHRIGDRVLAHVGVCLSHDVSGDEIVGRYGGEEFLAVLPRSSKQDVSRRAEAIRIGLTEQPCQTAEGIIPISVSCGAISMRANRPEEDIDAMLSRADQALYAAKHAGRNRVVVVT